MKRDAVYTKTEAGQREVAHRSGTLDGRHRTLLILLDGKRRVSELPPQMGDDTALAGMLGRLEALGLIVADGALAAASGPGPGAAAQPDWSERRMRAARMLNAILGPAGDGLAVRLESLGSEQQLPELLERCRRLIADLRGEAAVERFDAALDGP
ncbi:hypothetical protein [Luteimonas salinilitoris]|uniref:MarR family transcriptional regulator n=1 Tax=Luteimonas salinilitoris TaxID=3237697 RepID=A0ABV4HQQ2_9GAMM